MFDPLTKNNEEFLTSNYTSISVVIVVNRFRCGISQSQANQHASQQLVLCLDHHRAHHARRAVWLFHFSLPAEYVVVHCWFSLLLPSPYPHPADVGTRFSSIITLFLALMAVQFVVNSELPASSYALPTQQFIIVRVHVQPTPFTLNTTTSQATYVLYLLLTAESFLVYKIMLTKERKDAEAKQVCCW